jgi:ribosomal protein S18 acetylase RimI-like enzyme
MGFVIRELVPEDRPAIEEALTACAAFNEEEIRVALELFDSGDYSFFGAELGGDVEGYVCLGQAPLTQSTWYVYWICVHPKAQGQGVGRALQGKSEEFVRSRSGRRLVVETSGRADYHKARRFYETAGYERVGLIPDFYRPGDDCVIYAKVLE